MNEATAVIYKVAKMALRKGFLVISDYFSTFGNRLAPRLGLEPRTLKLTASCSAIELSGIVHLLKTDAILSTNWSN